MPVESPLRDGNGAGFELIETMRWEPQTGFLRGPGHLARLEASARTLGFAFDRRSIDAALSDAVGGDVAQRTRLTLARDGNVNVTTQPFVPLPADTRWRLRIATTRLASSDTLLRHKTTSRAAYDNARAEYSRDEADEVILLNESGAVCEGTITSVFADFGDGRLRTPPLASGLLAGVLRGEMIERGEAAEAKISAPELRRARAIWVGNSLRGLIGAILVDTAV